MDYRIEFSQWGRSFSVPASVVDDYIKISDGNFIKVLLCVFCNGDSMTSTQKLCDCSGLSEAVVDDAMAHWISLGVINAKTNMSATQIRQPISIVNAEIQAPNEPKTVSSCESIKPSKNTQNEHIKLRYSPKELRDKINNDSEIGRMVDQIQSVLGRTINPSETTSLIELYEYYGYSASCILMIAEFCKNKGKTRVAYLSAVAKDWFDNGIQTFTDVEKEIIKQTEYSSYEKSVLREMGLDNKPSKKQEDFIFCWNEWGFSVEMVKLAYDACLDSINNKSLPYINKILKNWHEKGLTTPAQVEADKLVYKNDTSPDTQEHSYDLDDIMLRALNTDLNEKRKDS